MSSRAVFVLSLPRSGSSCVAGALHRLGIDMGEGHWQPTDASNPKGYYEDLRWQVLNKDLAGHGYSSRLVYSLPDRHREAYRDLFELCSRNPLWGVKAPRMAYVFQHLHPIGNAFCDIRIVVIHRNLEHVTSSLIKHSQVAYGGRQTLTERRASALVNLWYSAMNQAVDSFGGPNLHIRYDHVIESPRKAINGLAQFCFDGRPMPNLQEAIRWVDPQMRHHA